MGDGEGSFGRDAGTPFYRRIASALRTRVETGSFAVGSMLPTEGELCDEFGASRHTIREALRVLTDLGMVARRRGSGTMVVSRTPDNSYVQTMRSLEELTQYAHDTRFEIRDVRQVAVEAELASVLATEPGSTWIRIEGVRWREASADAICATSVHVHLRFARYLHDVRETDGPIYDLIEKRSGEQIAEIIQEISGEPLRGTSARALELRAGTPSLRFLRRYLDQSGSTMLVSMNWHPTERFVYRMRLRRES